RRRDIDGSPTDIAAYPTSVQRTARGQRRPRATEEVRDHIPLARRPPDDPPQQPQRLLRWIADIQLLARAVAQGLDGLVGPERVHGLVLVPQTVVAASQRVLDVHPARGRVVDAPLAPELPDARVRVVAARGGGEPIAPILVPLGPARAPRAGQLDSLRAHRR